MAKREDIHVYVIVLIGLLQLMAFSSEGASTAGRPPCDESKNQFNRAPFGNTCHQGTEWDESIGCCTGCQICGPGFRQQPNCKGRCVECPPDHYSDKHKNLYCKGCTNCEKLHREYIKMCISTSNAECGNCLPGYTEKLYAPNECVKVQNITEERRGAFPGTALSQGWERNVLCEDQVPHNLGHVAVIFLSVAVVLLIGSNIAAVLCCYLKIQRERKLKKQEMDNLRKEMDNLRKEMDNLRKECHCRSKSETPHANGIPPAKEVVDCSEQKGGKPEKLSPPVKTDDEVDCHGPSSKLSNGTIDEMNDQIPQGSEEGPNGAECVADDDSFQPEDEQQDSMSHLIPETVATVSSNDIDLKQAKKEASGETYGEHSV